MCFKGVYLIHLKKKGDGKVTGDGWQGGARKGGQGSKLSNCLPKSKKIDFHHEEAGRQALSGGEKKGAPSAGGPIMSQHGQYLFWVLALSWYVVSVLVLLLVTLSYLVSFMVRTGEVCLLLFVLFLIPTDFSFSVGYCLMRLLWKDGRW